MKNFNIECKFCEFDTRVQSFIKGIDLNEFTLTIQLTDCGKAKAKLVYWNGNSIWV